MSSSRRLIITLRRFKTGKAGRSKKYKQLVLPTPGGYTREVAIRYHRRRPRGRHQRAGFITSTVRPQAVITATLIVIGVSGMAYFGTQIAQGHKLEPLKTFSSPPSVKAATGIRPLARSTPTRITVPAVGIDVPVTSVGRDSAGSIEMPPLFDWTTGWYKYSPTPGETGPAIIVGHVDTYKGISVFWHLRDIQRGDIINISRADGSTAKFKVTALKQFSQSDFPTQEVYGNIKYPGLRLITCGGAFDKQTESYTQNTVVYAFMVS
jgi:sortase (surface protein transpeptidase)